MEPAEQAALVFSSEFVFPHSQHAPAFLPECFRYKPIASLVAGDFFQPELRVIFRFHTVSRATVPEAAVDEHDEL